jgi:tetratricopeptide (TPR) repeat protein
MTGDIPDALSESMLTMPDVPDSEARSRDIDISRSTLSQWLQPGTKWLWILALCLVVTVLFQLGGFDGEMGGTLLALPIVLVLGVLVWIGWILIVRRGVLTWMRLAWAPARAMARGDVAGAERAYARALERARRFASGDHRRGLMLVELAGFAKNQGRYPEAKALFAESVEILGGSRRKYPIDYFVALNNYGIYFIHLRDFEAAQRILETALDVMLATKKKGRQDALAKVASPVELILHLNLVFLFIEMRALAEAADHLDEADDIFPGLSWRSRRRFGDHYRAVGALLMYAQGRFAEAAEELARAKNPDYPSCLRVRARLALVRQDYSEVEQLLRRSFDEQRKKGSLHLPEGRDSYLDFAESLFGQGKHDAAFAALQEARTIVADYGLPPDPRWRGALEGWLQRAKELERIETASSLDAELQRLTATPEHGITISAKLRVRQAAE